jgi:hypothetical protein
MTSKSRAFSRKWAWLVLPALLAACQTPGAALRPPTPQGDAVLGTSSAPGAVHAPSSGGGPLPSTAELTADPARFKGLTGPDIASLLGAPSFQRHDGEAEIWQYYGPDSTCVLDLFVYPDQDQPRVAHAELRSRGAGNASGCLAAILDGKRG